MALDTAFYLVSREVATRSGMINNRYRVADGRFVLDNKDLSRVRLTSEEYITGLAGCEKISKDDAMKLIARNGYKMGTETFIQTPTQSIVQEEEAVDGGEEQEQAPHENEETVDNENNKEE